MTTPKGPTNGLEGAGAACWAMFAFFLVVVVGCVALVGWVW